MPLSIEYKAIKNVLDKLYVKYNRHELIKPDPLQFVYNYSNTRDMELAGFFASALAYGRVEQIEKSVANLLGRMGESPYEYVRNFSLKKRNQFEDFRHRFNSGKDICDLLSVLNVALKEHKSLEGCFQEGYDESDNNIIDSLSRFCDKLCEIHRKIHGRQMSKTARYLLSNPKDGSVCKRLNMFLRWMVRDDNVDSGIWKSISKKKLVVPIDVHMWRLCRILGFCNRKSLSLNSALEITENFSKIEPDDPVKYDFALSRIGIVENCSGNYRTECRNCDLFNFCKKIKMWQ